MKVKNYDYQYVKPFEKAKPNVDFNPKRCFKYYIKQTNKNKVRALEETFKYIDRHYAKYKKIDKMNANEKYTNKVILIDRLSELDYDNQISFSVIYSIVISIVITLFFSALQTSNSSGSNFFEIINNKTNEFYTQLNQIPVVAAVITKFICNIIICALIIFIMSLPAVNLIIWVREKYESTKYVNNFLKPYEREVVFKTLSSYGSDYDFLK